MATNEATKPVSVEAKSLFDTKNCSAMATNEATKPVSVEAKSLFDTKNCSAMATNEATKPVSVEAKSLFDTKNCSAMATNEATKPVSVEAKSLFDTKNCAAMATNEATKPVSEAAKMDLLEDDDEFEEFEIDLGKEKLNLSPTESVSSSAAFNSSKRMRVVHSSKRMSYDVEQNRTEEPSGLMKKVADELLSIVPSEECSDLDILRASYVYNNLLMRKQMLPVYMFLQATSKDKVRILKNQLLLSAIDNGILKNS